MGFYRCVPTQSGGGDAASYTVSVNGELQQGTIANMFASTSTFNSPVVIGNNIRNAAFAFASAMSFNQPVTIPNNVMNCYNMFSGCSALNQPVTFGENVAVAYSMFYNCRNFNQPITIGPKVTNCDYMLFNCRNFNQPVMIGANVQRCKYLLANCATFNQEEIIIPPKAWLLEGMFSNVSSPPRDIYVQNPAYTNTSSMSTAYFVRGKSNSIRTNIHIQTGANYKFNNTGASNSIVGAAVTWTDMTDGNGFYNTEFNVYVYNNYTP